MNTQIINTGSEVVTQESVHYQNAVTPLMITSPRLDEVCKQFEFSGCFAEIKQGKSGQWHLARGYDWIMSCHPNQEGALTLCREAVSLGYLEENDLPAEVACDKA